MKKTIYLVALSAFVITNGCKNPQGEYVDLKTGEKITVVKDEDKGYMVNAETKKPVYLYFDAEKRDTFYGRTGLVVNTKLTKDEDGAFWFTGDDEYVYKNGDYKKKVDADGDYKVKSGDYKLKVEADGDIKIKDGDYKKKISEDGDIKIKDGNTKIKIEDGKVKVKKDDK